MELKKPTADEIAKANAMITDALLDEMKASGFGPQVEALRVLKAGMKHIVAELLWTSDMLIDASGTVADEGLFICGAEPRDVVVRANAALALANKLENHVIQ